MAKLKRTNTKEFTATVFGYLVDSTNVMEETPLTESEVATRLRDRFVFEYNHQTNRKQYPNKQQRVAQWLAGVPIGIDWHNYGILTTSAQWHGVTVEDLDDKQCEKIVSFWFEFLALFVVRLWDKHGFKLPR